MRSSSFLGISRVEPLMSQGCTVLCSLNPTGTCLQFRLRQTRSSRCWIFRFNVRTATQTLLSSERCDMAQQKQDLALRVAAAVARAKEETEFIRLQRLFLLVHMTDRAITFLVATGTLVAAPARHCTCYQARAARDGTSPYTVPVGSSQRWPEMRITHCSAGRVG